MARIAAEDGIQTLVATPHTLDGVYSNSGKEISEKVKEFQEHLTENYVDLRLCVGSDAHLSPNMVEKVKSGAVCTINDTGKYFLLEIPSQSLPEAIKDEIFALQLNGITPIITHPERHLIFQHEMDTLYEFVSMGALCQVTAMSITGEFGERVMHCAEALLRHRLIHIIASDSHSSSSRPPILSPSVDVAGELLGNLEEAERMVKDVPSSILHGESVTIPEPMRPKSKSIF